MTKFGAAAAAVLTFCAIAVPSVAFASDYAGPNTTLVTTPAATTVPAVVGRSGTAPAPATPGAVVGTTAGAPLAPSSLPFTGADIAGLVILGVVLVGGGTVLVLRRKGTGSATR
jgi:LPXTG-motif cell wall-anchored protein